MADPAAGPAPADRRPARGLGALLFAYLLLAPKLFLVLPLAGTLLLARPRRLREWLWLAVAFAACVALLAPAGPLPDQMLRAFAVLAGGAFVALELWRPAPAFRRAWQAIALGGVALWGWLRWLRLDPAVVGEEFVRSLGARIGAEATRWRTAGGNPEFLRLLDGLATNARPVVEVLPAWIGLLACAGFTLAWNWHRRVAAAPLPPPSARFRDFAFSDHAIWVLVAGLALWLLQVPPPLALAGTNLLVVAFALYALRGLAIAATAMSTLPTPVLVAVALVSLLLAVFVLGGLFALGVADTWLDFRRRLRPAPPEERS